MINELNLKILRELQKNGRATYLELKKKLGVEDTTIRKRIKRMEREGIIEGYTVEINPEALGYTITSFIGIKSEPNLTEFVARKVSELEGVIDAAVSTGPYDIVLNVVCKDVIGLGNIVTAIKNIEGITEVDTNILIKWFKKNGHSRKVSFHT
jgi:DNA-binding Lrp family transcriptional regulator